MTGSLWGPGYGHLRAVGRLRVLESKGNRRVGMESTRRERTIAIMEGKRQAGRDRQASMAGTMGHVILGPWTFGPWSR
jgi:hypothetical protein